MSAVRDLVGTELGPTSWLDVTQERIDAFAAATSDPQWIHVDPERAAEGPFGTTIAHGFLTLSLCVPMLYEVLPAGRRVRGELRRRTASASRRPFRLDARIRGRFRVVSTEETARGERAVHRGDGRM